MDIKSLIHYKKKYGRIFKLQLEGMDVYFRPLTIHEIKHFTNTSKIEEQIANLVILNDINLKLPGSFIRLAEYVYKYSVLNDKDDFDGRYLEIKRNVSENGYLHLITEICSVYPYTPDQLTSKTLDELIEIHIMAGMTRGGIPKKEKPQTPGYKENDKFEPPDVNSLMQESTNALDKEMKKHGKKVQQYTKKKVNPNLSPLHKQMQELNNFNA